MRLVSSIPTDILGMLSWVQALLRVFLKNVSSENLPISEEEGDGSLQRILRFILVTAMGGEGVIGPA